MPLLQINAHPDGLTLDTALLRQLRAALQCLTPDAPVVILLHGYSYHPGHPTDCPHDHIFAMGTGPGRKGALPWPSQLGVGLGGAEPLCIAVGWPARGSFWRAYAMAARIGPALGPLVRLITRLRPGRPVDLVAHSLGARVALSCLPHCPAGGVGQLLLLAPAELRSRAAAYLNSPAGLCAQVLTVTSRENAVFDRLVEWLVAPHRPGERAMGRTPHPRWITLQIDHAEVRYALHKLGFPISSDLRRVCHWSVYSRDGLFELYRTLLNRTLTHNALRHVLPQTATPAAKFPLELRRALLVGIRKTTG